MFKKATRKKVRARIALDGPAGSGKTFTALRAAYSFPGRNGNPPRVAVINTESGAIEKYLGLAPDGVPWEFDICDLTDYSPTSYTSAIMAAGREGYDVVLIDSLSHAWAGEGGALDLKDKKAADNRGNSFTAWKDITPMHNRMVEAILRSPCHLIVTMRTKMEYVVEDEINERGQKKSVVRKVGMNPIQRSGMEYEFDIVGDLDHTHTLTISKTRCPEVDGALIVKPGADFFAKIVSWVNEGMDIDPSYYAVTEAELLRIEAQRKIDAANNRIGRGGNGEGGTGGNGEAQQPPKHPRDLVKKRAKVEPAVQEVAPAPAATTAPATTLAEPAPFETSTAVEAVPRDDSVNSPCSRLQAEKIKHLVGELLPTEPDILDKINAILSHMAKANVRELTRTEADGLIIKLDCKLQKAFFGGDVAAANESNGQESGATPIAEPVAQEVVGSAKN